ncbi:hypothetical protein, partial [Klebsiella pneumoniae]|uniref:hypothetical protein n=1 Tax=Klebsiella pneumoniae TaxID=573 RepID=UPI001BE0C075
RFLPSTVQPAHLSSTAPAGTTQNNPPTIAKAAAKYAKSIVPILTRSFEDRHWALLTKLIADFYEDRKHLVNPVNLTTHNNDRKGIHVFVDAS